MIKKIRSSLSIKICLLLIILLTAASGITYAAVVGFLPTYYSSRLREDLDEVSAAMAETISTYKSIDEASQAIELFEASLQVSVTILDSQGMQVWPQPAVFFNEEGTAIESDAVEETFTGDDVSYMSDTEFADAIVQIMDSSGEVSEMVIAQGTAEEEGRSQSAVNRYDFKMGGQTYTMLVSGGMQPVNQALEILHQLFPYIFAISVLAALVLALVFTAYLTMPVVRLSKISKSMASLDFSGQYQGTRTDEIGVLGENLNELSANLSDTLEELRSANEKLRSDIELERQIEQKRIAFFSAVSHELKTPITILKGHLSGMIQGVGEYKNRDHYLYRSQETAEKMETMVQELLTVSRMENGKFTVQRTDVAEQLRQLLADLTELVEKKMLGLEVDIPEHLYAEVNSGMMEKVFSNLLMNAIRYTPEGKGNRIRIAMRPETLMGRTFCCRIENTGVFIPEEALPRVFEAFYRVEQSRSRQTGGSGLGLYIVKMALDQHGAEYEVRNTPEGVEFWFSL